MRFHVLGVPHTVSNHEYVACAFTQKVVKFGEMMTGEPGIELIHYGHEESTLPCDEHVTVTTNADLQAAYGNYDWRNGGFFKYDFNDVAYQAFYKNAIAGIKERFQCGDFILPFWGCGVRPVCDAIENDPDCPQAIVVEPGIGYPGGQWAKYKVWESYAIMHSYYGMKMVERCNPIWYDTVIPNYFDPNNFNYRDESQKEDYFLYLGRVFEGKGVHIAVAVAKKLGIKLKIAGQKDSSYSIPDDDNIEFLGYADLEMRRELMSKALCSFMPSTYIEPFGGVFVENMLSGTPVISTDWGAFAENNIHGVTGYRCRTLQDFITATQNVLDGKLSCNACYQWGQNFTYNAIRPRYLKFFNDVHDLWFANGWYEMHGIREDLDAIQMHLPK